MSDQVGVAVIGNLDNNKLPSIIVPRDRVLSGYKYDGTITLDLVWDIMTTDSSGTTVPTIFDLNGDGINELIYR
ncbi:MAG: hypothetical protein IPL98_08800, partial [Saprospiraceae bacterium]|nr:hypothetical protein [Saprospiraceae bacterium]